MIRSSTERRAEAARVARRFTRLYQHIAAYALSTLLLLLALEGLARFGMGLRNQVTDDPRSSLPSYRTESWNVAYWKELGQAVSKPRYQEYVGWRSPEYHGRHININSDGLRMTPGANCHDGSFKVFMFGGSTMWGVGAPDDATIPAYLQTLLSELRPQSAICVTNFGVLAGVSTQSVVSLEEELRHGDVPDLVVFYDGANDVLAAFQADRAGAVQYSAYRRDHYENRIPLAWTLNNQYALFHIAASLMQKLRGQPLSWTYANFGSYSKELVEDVLSVYLENIKIVQTLGRVYGFDAHFFWQPIVTSGQKPLTAEEIVFRRGMDPRLVDFYADVYGSIADAAKKTSALHDLAHALDDISEQVYIDYVHISPSGNKRIATMMVDGLSR